MLLDANEARAGVLRHRPHFTFRFLPLPAFLVGRFIGLRTGRGARTRLREGTGIVDETIPAFSPSSHSMTSSARARSVGGTAMPSAFAVFRLMTSSNLVGASTGISLGLSPFRMRST